MIQWCDGPLAHLVERIHGMDEVAGSSPAWSTKERLLKSGAFFILLKSGALIL